MRKHLLLIAVAVVVVLLAGWYVVLWGPQGSNLRQARAEVVKAATARQRLLMGIASLHAAERMLPSEVNALQRTVTAVPVEARVPALIDQVQQTASSTGVTVATESQALAPAAVATTGSAGTATTVATVTLSLTLAGSYGQVSNFVTTLEHGPRLVVVDTLNLTPGAGGVQAAITARAFYDPAPLPDVRQLGSA